MGKQHAPDARDLQRPPDYDRGKGDFRNMKRLNSHLSEGQRTPVVFPWAKKGSKGASSVVTFHVFVGKFPPPRGLFTNLRGSIKEAKSINQPDAKPGIKKPRPKRGAGLLNR